jgi:hypothetical protein
MGRWVTGWHLPLLFAVCVARQADAADSAILTWPDNGHQYQYIDAYMDYPEAKAYAEGKGAYLLTLTSAAEADWVQQQLVTPHNHKIWLGLVQQKAPTPGAWGPGSHWRWVTGEPFGYSDWYSPQEPNDWPSAIEDNQQNNAVIFADAQTWLDEGTAPSDAIWVILEWSTSPASVNWTGAPGYQTDAVQPDTGGPDSTDFVFKARYTDPRGKAPTTASVVIDRLDCAGWVKDRVLHLTRISGGIVAGAVYSGTTKLPNAVYRHTLWFRDVDGYNIDPPAGAPAPGPYLQGPPQLCWRRELAYSTDGVNPNSGAAGTVFRFSVRYRDGTGDAPTVRRVRLRKDEVNYTTKDLAPWGAGDNRTGQNYGAALALTQPGVYQYSFEFADGDGAATGAPTGWKDGPTLDDGSAGMLGALAAVPTRDGAQISFTLSGPASVTATIVNLAGRPIRTLVSDRPTEAGLQSILWDGRAETGLTVPSGVYLVRVTAHGTGGGTSTALASVAVR